MYEFWDVQNFQNQNPGNFAQEGDQFIGIIITKTMVILDQFNERRFLNTLPPLAEISVKSFHYEARQMAESSERLQEYLTSFMVVDGNVVRLNEQFQEAEQQHSAQLLLQMVRMVRETVNNWKSFRQQQIEGNLFQEQVDLLCSNFQLQQDEHWCRLCQLI